MYVWVECLLVLLMWIWGILTMRMPFYTNKILRLLGRHSLNPVTPPTA